MLTHIALGETVHYVPRKHVNPTGKHVVATIIDILDQVTEPGLVELSVFVPSSEELMGNQPVQRIKAIHDSSLSEHSWHYRYEFILS